MLFNVKFESRRDTLTAIESPKMKFEFLLSNLISMGEETTVLFVVFFSLVDVSQAIASDRNSINDKKRIGTIKFWLM